MSSSFLPLKAKDELRPGTRRPFHFRQHVEQFFGHAVAEIFVAFVRAHVHKRQHGDGFLTGCAGVAEAAVRVRR